MSIDSNVEQFLWVEKYRPKKIDECILPQGIKDTFNQFVGHGRLPNFILTGGAGTGKTTIARALCNEVGAEYIFINGSEESGIDMLRTKVKGFASTVSLTDSKKVVIIDEADYLTGTTQAAMRSMMEEFSNNCSFILTCNFKNRIIDPLHSRCNEIDFNIPAAEKQALAAGFFKRIKTILDMEKVDYDKNVVIALITKHFPDFRKILNELQRYSVSGKIDSGILLDTSTENYKELIGYLKDKKFTDMRKWIGKNSDIDTPSLYRMLFDRAADIVTPETVPNLILILGDYQEKAAFVVDHQINNTACMIEIMSQVEFQ